MDVFAPLAVVISVIYSAGNLIKQLQGGQTKHAVTQLSVWVIGIGLALVLGASDFGDSVVLGDWVLGQVDALSQAIAGLGLAAAANVVYDALPINTPTIGTNRADTDGA